MRPHDLSRADEPWASVLLLHPHPEMGGDRFNNVVTALYDALPPAGVNALRFDFSSSNIDVARGETLEMLELLSFAPRFLVGYSFGGRVAAAVMDQRVHGWFLVAPASTIAMTTFRDDPRPSFVVAAEHDQFFPPSDLRADAIVAGANHFFVGRTDEVTKQCLTWLRRVAR